MTTFEVITSATGILGAFVGFLETFKLAVTKLADIRKELKRLFAKRQLRR